MHINKIPLSKSGCNKYFEIRLEHTVFFKHIVLINVKVLYFEYITSILHLIHSLPLT